MLQPFSHNNNYQNPYLQINWYLYLSSSPDLRIHGSATPSQKTPMTGFRLVQNLHAYSGGTVRELHTIIYSPMKLLPHP